MLEGKSGLVFSHGSFLDGNDLVLQFSHLFLAEIVRYNQYDKLAVLVNNELNEYMLPAGKTAVLSNGKKMAAP